MYATYFARSCAWQTPRCCLAHAHNCTAYHMQSYYAVKVLCCDNATALHLPLLRNQCSCTTTYHHAAPCFTSSCFTLHHSRSCCFVVLLEPAHPVMLTLCSKSLLSTSMSERSNSSCKALCEQSQNCGCYVHSQHPLLYAAMQSSMLCGRDVLCANTYCVECSPEDLLQLRST